MTIPARERVEQICFIISKLAECEVVSGSFRADVWQFNFADIIDGEYEVIETARQRPLFVAPKPKDE